MPMGYFIRNFLELFAYLISFAILLFHLRHWWHIIWYRALILLSVFNAATIGMATFLTLTHTPNLFWYDLSGLGRLLCTMIFFLALPAQRMLRIIVGITGVAAVMVYVTLWLEVNDGRAIFSWGFGIVYGIILLWCLIYLFNTMKNLNPQHNLLDDPAFWMLCLLTIYHGTAYLILIAYRYLTLAQSGATARPLVTAGDLWGLYSVIVALSWLSISGTIVFFSKKIIARPINLRHG